MFLKAMYLLLLIVFPVLAAEPDDIWLSIGILLFLTPVGWAIGILLVITIIIGLVKLIGKGAHRVAHSEEYRKISEFEKREELLKVLSEEHSHFL